MKKSDKASRPDMSIMDWPQDSAQEREPYSMAFFNCQVVYRQSLEDEMVQANGLEVYLQPSKTEWPHMDHPLLSPPELPTRVV